MGRRPAQAAAARGLVASGLRTPRRCLRARARQPKSTQAAVDDNRRLHETERTCPSRAEGERQRRRSGHQPSASLAHPHHLTNPPGRHSNVDAPSFTVSEYDGAHPGRKHRLGIGLDDPERAPPSVGQHLPFSDREADQPRKVALAQSRCSQKLVARGEELVETVTAHRPSIPSHEHRSRHAVTMVRIVESLRCVAPFCGWRPGIAARWWMERLTSARPMSPTGMPRKDSATWVRIPRVDSGPRARGRGRCGRGTRPLRRSSAHTAHCDKAECLARPAMYHGRDGGPAARPSRWCWPLDRRYHDPQAPAPRNADARSAPQIMSRQAAAPLFVARRARTAS